MKILNKATFSKQNLKNVYEFLFTSDLQPDLKQDATKRPHMSWKPKRKTSLSLPDPSFNYQSMVDNFPNCASTSSLESCYEVFDDNTLASETTKPKKNFKSVSFSENLEEIHYIPSRKESYAMDLYTHFLSMDPPTEQIYENAHVNKNGEICVNLDSYEVSIKTFQKSILSKQEMFLLKKLGKSKNLHIIIE